MSRRSRCYEVSLPDGRSVRMQVAEPLAPEKVAAVAELLARLAAGGSPAGQDARAPAVDKLPIR